MRKEPCLIGKGLGATSNQLPHGGSNGEGASDSAGPAVGRVVEGHGEGIAVAHARVACGGACCSNGRVLFAMLIDGGGACEHPVLMAA